MDYLALKHFHMSCAGLSLTLFLARAAMRWRAPQMLTQRVWRVLPHIVDTALLGSAIGLAWWSGQAPWTHPWLAAKIGALLAYIGFGTYALKRARTAYGRAMALVAALACFGYIVAVAVSKSPMPWA